MTAGGPVGSGGASLLEVLAGFEAQGYTTQLIATDEGRIRCTACGRESDPATASLAALRRLEGASDPDDMLAVLALSCPLCASKGTAVLSYGPESSPGEAAVLLAVEDARPDH